MRTACSVLRNGTARNKYKFLVAKPEGKKPSERPMVAGRYYTGT